jgi:subtilisin family serine protease
VGVPASHPGLIAVGSTENRSAWIDYSGGVVGTLPAEEPLSYFSSCGPNATGNLKPDLVAPGGWIIAAMAAAADPRTSLRSDSQFASGGGCPDEVECLVIDDEHGISSGTSMSAPLVTGTVALLMQREPTLTMAQERTESHKAPHSDLALELEN